MTGQEAIDLIHQRAWIGRKPGLSRTQTLLRRLGNPEGKLKFVHITGTNGKGSTAAMVASVLSAAGYRTGLSTSPHLSRFHERIQVDGEEISDGQLGEITRRVLQLAEDMEDHPTEFELMTAVSLDYFLRAGCDIVVLEVGLGGRLDSTNVIPPPEVAVITNIGLEHTELLGDTIPQIALEKAGILKTGSDAVVYRQGHEAEQVVTETCHRLHIPLCVTDPGALEPLSASLEGQVFRYRGEGPYFISLLGAHQLRNAMTALDTLAALRHRGWDISQGAIRNGLSSARWPGRLELVRRSPDFIVDGGHNPQCLDALASALKDLYPGKQFLFLTGVMADKDYEAMLDQAAPLAKGFVAITPDSPRALPGEELGRLLRARYGLPVTVAANAAAGTDVALSLAGPEDVICAFGSLYSVGEIRHRLGLW